MICSVKAGYLDLNHEIQCLIINRVCDLFALLNRLSYKQGASYTQHMLHVMNIYIYDILEAYLTESLTLEHYNFPILLQ